MCYFLTLAVPAERAEDLRQYVPRGLAATVLTNRGLGRQLGPAYVQCVLTSGMCSCDLYLPEPGQGSDTHAQVEKRRRKYERMGWSEAKIARALSSRSEHRAPQAAFVGIRPDVRELVARLADAMGRIGVLVHWYDGDLEHEQIDFARGPEVGVESFSKGEPSVVADQLVFVARGK